MQRLSSNSLNVPAQASKHPVQQSESDVSTRFEENLQIETNLTGPVSYYVPCHSRSTNLFLSYLYHLTFKNKRKSLENETKSWRDMLLPLSAITDFQSLLKKKTSAWPQLKIEPEENGPTYSNDSLSNGGFRSVYCTTARSIVSLLGWKIQWSQFLIKIAFAWMTEIFYRTFLLEHKSQRFWKIGQQWKILIVYMSKLRAGYWIDEWQSFRSNCWLFDIWRNWDCGFNSSYLIDDHSDSVSWYHVKSWEVELCRQ